MTDIVVKIPDKLIINEFCKIISFISEGIVSYQLQENELIVTVDDTYNKEEIYHLVHEMMKKYVSTQEREKIIFSNIDGTKSFYTEEFDDIHIFEEGIIGLNHNALFLYKYFEECFNKIANELETNSCIEKLYPVLINVKEYQKTGYLVNSPQYSMFCCSACENIKIIESINKGVQDNRIKSFLKEPQYALSPSACFHTYIEYKNQELQGNTTITFTQSVFRNEGRFNFGEFGRLLDYHVKEIVFIGDCNYVNDMREKAIEKVIELLSAWGIQGIITTSSDPFVIPKMQKYKTIQLLEASKYELRLIYEKDHMLSVASFNYHGTAFTHPFNISVKGTDINETVTGCIGFGLERWVMAFLRQYGNKVEMWPQVIKEEYYEKH